MGQLDRMADKTPKWKSAYSFIILNESSMLVRSFCRMFKVNGTSVGTVLKDMLHLLNGKNSIEEILAILSNINDKVIYDVLSLLEKYELIEYVEKKEVRDNSFLNQWTSLQNEYYMQFSEDTVKESINKIADAKIFVFGMGVLGVSVIRNLITSGFKNISRWCNAELNEKKVDIDNFLSKEKIESLPDDVKFKEKTNELSEEDSFYFFKKYDLVIVCNDRRKPHFLKKINSACIQNKVRLIITELNGAFGTVGPIVYPGETACWHCYDMRRRSNLHPLQEIKTYEKNLDNEFSLTGKVVTIYPFIEIITAWTVAEIIKITTGCGESTGAGKFFEFDFMTMETKNHSILKIPRCPVCGPMHKMPNINIWDTL